MVKLLIFEYKRSLVVMRNTAVLREESVESPILVRAKMGTWISCKMAAVRRIVLFSPV